MAFTEEQLALVSQYSPSYKSSLASESKAVNDRRMEMEQAKQRAQYMTDNRDQLLGKQQVLGLPSQNPSLQTQPGTLAYAQGTDPRQTQLMERNFAMNTSGMPKLMEQGLSDSSSMQGDIMSMVKDEYKAGYTPRKADTSLEQLTQYRDRLEASGADVTDVNAAIDKVTSEAGIKVQTDIHAPDKTFDNTTTLRKEFQGLPDVKKFYEARGAYDQIQTALDNPSAAGALAAATKFMKILDPGSVVRESELLMAMQATGKLDMFFNTFERLKKGKVLTPSQTKDFKKVSTLLFSEANKRFNQRADQYRGYAEKDNYDAGRVADRSDWVNPYDRPQNPKAGDEWIDPMTDEVYVFEGDE